MNLQEKYDNLKEKYEELEGELDNLDEAYNELESELSDAPNCEYCENTDRDLIIKQIKLYCSMCNKKFNKECMKCELYKYGVYN